VYKLNAAHDIFKVGALFEMKVDKGR